MADTLIRTRDGIHISVPEGMDPNGPEVREAVATERAGRLQRKMASPEFKAQADAQRAKDRELYDPTAGMGKLDLARANVGAGLESTWMGLKQILPGVKGPTDEEIQEKRHRDEQLSKATDMGILPDWAPTMGRALQFGGEVAPTLLIPGGPIAGVGAKLLPRALVAASKFALKTPVRAGALQGAAAGALMPTTSDESKLFNTALGAGGGAALPLALKGARGIRENFTEAGTRAKVAEMLGVKHDTPLPADPAALGSRGAENVPLSTAATYGDPTLASAELASRARGRSTEDWANLDRAQRQEVWKNVEAGTQRAGTEGEARAARQEGWQERTANAMEDFKPRKWGREMAQLRQNLDAALRSPMGQNEMRPVLNEVVRQMDELGPNFSPGHLAQLRSRMNRSVRGSPNDPFSSAPVGDPAYISLKSEFDDILNSVTGNRWGRVLKGYSEESVPVAQAKAESRVQEHFITPEGTPRVRAPEGFPAVTEAGLRTAVTLPERANKFGTAPTFEPESGKVLKGTLEALRRQNITQTAKQTATGGGGSMTQPLQQLISAIDPSQAGNLLVKAVQVAKNMGHQSALRELDQALIDPQRYYRIVTEAIQKGQPPSPGMQVLMGLAAQAAQGGAGRLGPDYLQSLQQEQR